MKTLKMFYGHHSLIMYGKEQGQHLTKFLILGSMEVKEFVKTLCLIKFFISGFTNPLDMSKDILVNVLEP